MANIMTITYQLPENAVVSLKDIIDATFFKNQSLANDVKPDIQQYQYLIKNIKLRFATTDNSVNDKIIGGYYIRPELNNPYNSGFVAELNMQDFIQENLQANASFNPVVLSDEYNTGGYVNNLGAFNSSTERDKYFNTTGNLFLVGNGEELLLNNVSDPINYYYIKSLCNPLYISAHFTS